MDDLNCPDCGELMMDLRSGTRAGGSGPGPWPEHGIPTTATCTGPRGCGRTWDRDYGDQGDWRSSVLAWSILPAVEVVRPSDPRILRYTLVKGDDERRVTVELTSSLQATSPETLPSPVHQALATDGRVIVLRALDGGRTEPPSKVIVHTEGWSAA